MAHSYLAMGVEGEGLRKNTGLTRWGESQMQFFFFHVSSVGDDLYSISHKI